MYLMIPAAAMCNYVFVLPVGTAPNALAFGVANWKLSDTVRKRSYEIFQDFFVILIELVSFSS